MLCVTPIHNRQRTKIKSYANRQHHQQYIVLVHVIFYIWGVRSLLPPRVQMLSCRSLFTQWTSPCKRNYLPVLQTPKKYSSGQLLPSFCAVAKASEKEMGLHKPASTKPDTATENAPALQTIVHVQHTAISCYHFSMYVQWCDQVFCLYEALVQSLTSWGGTGFKAHSSQKYRIRSILCIESSFVACAFLD